MNDIESKYLELIDELLLDIEYLNSWEQAFVRHLKENCIKYANPIQLEKLNKIYKSFKKKQEVQK